jgi:GNAT superfamily N-acetyltransferase
MTPGLRIEKLRPDHAVECFDCGKAALNRFLVRHALQSQQAGGSTTYLAVDGAQVVGFYSLVYGQVDYADAPERLAKGMARHPISIMLLARLAVSAEHQNRRIGSGLLKDAMLRTLQAAEIAGLRALVVHAKDDDARRFYARFDFMPSASDPYHLALLLKDLRAIVATS